MHSKIRNFFIAAAVIAIGGLVASDAAPVLAAEQEAAPIVLRQPAPIAYWPTKCDPTKLQYVFPAKTVQDSCRGKGVLSGPGWWWRAWPGLVSGGSYYLSVYDAPAPPSASSKAQFFPTISVPGYYDIWISYRTTHNRADETPFWIFPDDGKTYKMFVNEKGPEGFRAVKLGNFFLGLHAKNKAIVEMRNNEGTHSKGIDGIFIKYTGPKNPAALTATRGVYDDRIVLNWRHQAGVTSYRIYRGTTSSPAAATYLRGIRTNATARVTTFSDLTATGTGNYFYWLRSVGSLGKVAKGFSNMATGNRGVAPAAPATATATQAAGAPVAVRITWDTAPTATSYGIYRADTADGAKTLLGVVPATANPLQYSDATVVVGNTYHYFVTSKLAQMESDFAGAAPVTVPAELAPPTNVIANQSAPVVVEWQPVGAETSYGIYRADTADGAKTLLADVLATANPLEYIDATSVSGNTYYYFVTARLGEMESDFVAAAPVTVP